MADTLNAAGLTPEIRKWLPEGAPKGVVQILHGMAEHISRYDRAAKALNDAGHAVVGHDHLGHGKSAEILGWFAEKNGWDALTSQAHAVRTAAQAEFPGVPYFLLGHSMGSFLARTYCLAHEKGLKGVVLSGTAHFKPMTLSAGLLVSNLHRAFGGDKKPCGMLARMSFAGYNKAFENPRTAYDWLSKNEENVDEYVRDPLCGFTFTAGGYHDLFTGLKRLAPDRLSAMEKDIPIYLFSGDSDPVGENGVGVNVTADELRVAGVKDVTVKLYEGGRHEMLNEPESERVIQDLIAWLDARL